MYVVCGWGQPGAVALGGDDALLYGGAAKGGGAFSLRNADNIDHSFELGAGMLCSLAASGIRVIDGGSWGGQVEEAVSSRHSGRQQTPAWTVTQGSQSPRGLSQECTCFQRSAFIMTPAGTNRAALPLQTTAPGAESPWAGASSTTQLIALSGSGAVGPGLAKK